MNRDSTGLNLELRGVDMVTPVDLLSDGRTPWSKNFRLYAQQSDSRQVAVSSRKGPGYYMSPIVETVDYELDSTDDINIPIGVTANVFAQYLDVAGSGRLNRLDIKLRKTQPATGPVIVSVYSAKDDRPSELLTQSSVEAGAITNEYKWHTVRFHKAPLVDEDELYIVIESQDDGTGLYELSGVSQDTGSMFSDVSFAALQPVNDSPNIKVYLTPDSKCKGAFRFNREDGNNITMAVYGTTMYALDPLSNKWDVVISNLSENATEYSFARVDGKVFWVNGYDELMSWDGAFPEENPNLISPSTFESDIGSWEGANGSTLTRDTSNTREGRATLRTTNTNSGNKAAHLNVDIKGGVGYKVGYWVKAPAGAAGETYVNVGGGVGVSPGHKLVGRSGFGGTDWRYVEHRFAFSADYKRVELRAAGENYTHLNLDSIVLKETGVEVITDPELPILSQIILHKDRIFGVAANDKNRLVWSESPGNPSDAPANKQWYRAWMSINFWYVPAPKTGSPITGLVSFQDSLIIFTQNNKYVFSGYDKGSFNLRQSTGSKGALSNRGIVSDKNYIYFVADDGFYQFNGSQDTNISETRIQPLFDGIPRKNEVTPVIWENKVRWYMPSLGSPVNDMCALFNPGIGGEWEVDLETYVDRAIHFDDADDNGELLEFSSHYAMPMLAEKDYHSLGAPIDFEYRFKYDAFGAPAQKKRIRRYFPILQGVDNTFRINIAMDKDFEDSPRIKEVLLSVQGSTWGDFQWDDGTTWGGDKSFKQHRQSYPGSAYYWQLRVARKGVHNRVAFTGAQYRYRMKRL